MRDLVFVGPVLAIVLEGEGWMNFTDIPQPEKHVKWWISMLVSLHLAMHSGEPPKQWSVLRPDPHSRSFFRLLRTSQNYLGLSDLLYGSRSPR